MSITSPIIPAIIPTSYEDLVLQVTKLRGLPEVHIDVIDGIFAPAASWPYHDQADVTVAYELLAPFSLEVDLMAEKPIPAAHIWLKAGADQLVFHVETISVEAFKQFAFECPVSVGVACSNSTPLQLLYQYLPFTDYVQCMGIATIGSQGQPFDESVLERLKQIQIKFPKLPLSIDGSINETTILLLKDLKLSRYIVGSAIMNAREPKEMYRILTALTKN